LVFVFLTAAQFGDHPALSTDEAWVLGTSYELATNGALGAPALAGFFGADQHWFGNLPLQYIAQAISFRVFSDSVEAGRLVSALASLGLIWIVAILAWRWWGVVAAVAATFLLVMWPSGLIAGPEVPLLRHARSARYDVLPATLAWLAVLLFDVLRQRPTRVRAFLMGVAAAGASLAHFWGMFVVPLIALAWLWLRDGPPARVMAYAPAAALGFVALIVPYAALVAVSADDAFNQLSALYGRRLPSDIASVVGNVLAEPARYGSLADGRAAGSWLMLLVIPAFALLVHPFMQRNRASASEKLLLLGVCVPAALLAVAEATKAPIYAMALLPSVVLLLAFAATRVWEFGRKHANTSLRVGVIVALSATALITAYQGVTSHQALLSAAAGSTSFIGVEGRLRQSAATEGVVLGSLRWSWTFRREHFRSDTALFYPWQIGSIDPLPPPRSLGDVLRDAGVSVILLDDDLRRNIATLYPTWLAGGVLDQLARCATLVDAWDAGSYGRLEVYTLGGAACGA
jgi:4-amino-4-deoxy-L-arabinose transferase-like glycosyltransferase